MGPISPSVTLQGLARDKHLLIGPIRVSYEENDTKLYRYKHTKEGSCLEHLSLLSFSILAYYLEGRSLLKREHLSVAPLG